MKRLLISAVATGLLLALSAPAMAADNGGFESGTPTGGSSSSLSGFASGIDSWSGWNNTAVLTTISAISPSTDPFAPGGDNMIHIVSTGDQNGLFQFLGGFSFLSADFFVSSGSAYMFAVGAGVTETTQTGVWQHLTFNGGGSGEIAIYTGANGGDFYVDNVVTDGFHAGEPEHSVTTFQSGAPEPTSWALMIMGFGAAGALLRRRREIFAA